MKINENNYKRFTIFILILVGISTLITYTISGILEKNGVRIPWYIETPSIPGIYALLFWIFDKYLWKYNFFKKIGIIIADDLSGEWEGFSISSYDNQDNKIKTKIIIEQSATKIKVYGLFNQSKSVSIHENFGYSEIDNKVALYYFFRNEPSYNAVETMAIHEGSVKLLHDSKNKVLCGYYFSGRNRNNYGTIEVRKII